MHHNIMPAFTPKLDLWKNRIELSESSKLLYLESELRTQIKIHLFDMKQFIKYFPDIDEKRETWKFIRNPF